jgi:hypothetical protein
MAGSSDGRLDAQYDRALALSKRYEGSGDLRDLDAAIEAWERLAHQPGFTESALSLQTGAQSNWSTYLVRRYFATGNRTDLDTALARWEQALSKVSPASSEGLMLLNNLGAGLRVRYSLTGALTDLDVRAGRCRHSA